MHLAEIIWKNLLRRPSRSMLTAAGVMVATAAVMSLLSVSAALSSRSGEIYTSRQVDVVVNRAGVTERLTSNLDESLGVRLAVLPQVKEVAPALSDMVLLQGDGILGVPLCGWPKQSFLFDLLELIQGQPLDSAKSQGVLLGAVLAENLAKQTGEELDIEGVPFVVRGIFRSSNVWENGSAIILLADMQDLMDRHGQVTEFQIRMTPEASATEGAAEALCRQIETLKHENGRPLGVSAMPTQQHIDTNARMVLVKAMAWITTVIALVIGSIGMLNTMMMALLERTQEIGTLRAIGWRRSRIMRLILGESLALSMAGAAIGIVIAWTAMFVLRQIPGVRVTISPELTGTAVVTGLGLTVLFGVFGGAYPAYRGANLLPAEAIHDQ